MQLNKKNPLPTKKMAAMPFRKETDNDLAKQIRCTIASSGLMQKARRQVNKRINKWLTEDHPITGVNISQRASRKSLTTKTQTKFLSWRRCEAARNYAGSNCAGFLMRRDKIKNIAPRDDSQFSCLITWLMANTNSRTSKIAVEVLKGAIRSENGTA